MLIRRSISTGPGAIQPSRVTFRPRIHSPLRICLRSSSVLPLAGVKCNSLSKRMQGDSGYADVRNAIAQQLSRARSWQDVQDILDRYGDYLSPAEISQLVSAAPRLAPTQLQKQRSRVSSDPALKPWYPSAAAAARQAEAAARAAAAERKRKQQLEQQERAAKAAAAQNEKERAQYGDMMRRLADLSRRNMTQAEAPTLADTAYALAHAGALDEDHASELLSHASEQAGAGKLSVQGLADVLSALATARFRPTPTVMNKLLQDVDPLSRCQTPQELSSLLEGLSRIGYQADEAFVERVMNAMQQRQAQRETQRQREEAAKRQQEAVRKQQEAAKKLQQQMQQVFQQQQVQAESEGAETDEEVEEQEREEARHVAAAVQALQRMGHTRQAEKLKLTYLRDLQVRAGKRLQERQRREQDERLRAEQEERQRQEKQQQQQQLRAEQARMEQERAEKLRREEAERKRQEEQETAAQAEERRLAGTRSAVRDAISRAGSWTQLRSMLYSVPEYLGFEELVQILSALPRTLATPSMGIFSWQERAALTSMLETWGSLMAERIDEGQATPELLVKTVKALVTLRWLDQQVLGVLLREARKQLPGFTVDLISGLLQCLAQVSLRPSSQWLDAFVNESAGKLKGGSVDTLLSLANSLARLQVRPPASWLLAYLGAVQEMESSLSSREAAACLRAAAVFEPGLVDRWYAGLMESRRVEALKKQLEQASSVGALPLAQPTKSSAESSPATVPPAPALSSIEDDMDREEQDKQGPSQKETSTGAISSHPVTTDADAGNVDEEGAAGSSGDSFAYDDNVASIDFDEEGAKDGASSQKLPDTFLLDQMQLPSSFQGDNAYTGELAQDGADVVVEPEVEALPPLTPSEAKALRSVILERVELVEETYDRVAEVQEASRTRIENAALVIANLRSQIQVLESDYNRVKLRHEEEKTAGREKVQQDIMAKLLPVIDNFDRAAMSLKPATEGEARINKAYADLPQQMLDLLREAGIEEVPGEGESFNPAYHDAIMQEYDTSVPDGTVLMVLQKGYKSGERLIRPALVKVSTC